MTRKLYEIADDIRAHWVKKDGTPNVWFGAEPYLDAMSALSYTDDMFGADDAKTIVIYFLSNATTWRGEDARRIKAELKTLVGLK